MDIKTLCLGLLCGGDASGYDLKKQFESTFKHFYPAGFGSIYPSLADLADKKFVTCREMPQKKKPDRKVYTITEEGREAFKRSLYKADPKHKLRSEYLVVAYFADFVDHDTLNAMLTDWERDLDDSVSRFDELQDRHSEDISPCSRFVIGFGKAVNQAMADYINDHRDLLIADDANKAVRRATSETTAKPLAHTIESRQ